MRHGDLRSETFRWQWHERQSPSRYESIAGLGLNPSKTGLVSRSLVDGGQATDPDHVIRAWAVANDHVVFTHDLDFSTVLALTRATGPSVIQVRTEDVSAGHLEFLVIAAIKQHEMDLASGAVVVVDEAKCRVRVLPIQ